MEPPSRFFWSLAAIAFLLGSGARVRAGDPPPKVVLARLDGAVGPASSEWLQDAFLKAHAEDAALLLIELDTPGGLLESTRLLVQEIFASSVPVAVYVAPAGARAASAGTFLLLAAHVAAMAPGTRVGAAHPVELGKESQGDLRAKMENDAAAFIRTIAESRGRNARWAEDAVRRSSAATEQEALALKVIDLIASDRDALLAALEGRAVKTAGGSRTLHLAGAAVEPFPMSWRLRVLKTLTDPNVAYILMMIGIYGILYEIIHPGAVLPGVAGSICLVLGLYALQTLPVNAAGLALLAVAVVLFAIETQVTSGLLGLGGLIALFLGSVLLIRSDFPEWQVSRALILGVIGFTGVLLGAGFTMLWKVRRRRVVTGAESMAGQIARTRTALEPRGQVLCQGEIWNAVSESGEPIPAGMETEVVAVRGLTLGVRIKK